MIPMRVKGIDLREGDVLRDIFGVDRTITGLSSERSLPGWPQERYIHRFAGYTPGPTMGMTVFNNSYYQILRGKDQ